MRIENPDQYDGNTEYVKMIIFGQSGSGKTTFCSNAGKSMVVDLEKGLGKNRPHRTVIEEYTDFEKFIQLMKGEKYTSFFDTVAIDSLNELVEIVIRDVVLSLEVKRIYNDQLTQGDYGLIAREVNKLVRKLINELGPFYHLIFTCAENPTSYEGEQKNLSLVGKVLPTTLPRIMDIVGCAFTKGNEHFLTVGNSSFAFGKNRYGLSPNPLPLNFDHLINLISEV